MNGGVILLAHKRLPQRQLHQSFLERAQLLIVAVAGLYVGSLYSPPDREGEAMSSLCNLVTDYMQENSNHQT